MVCAPVRRDNPRAKARGLSLRTGAQTMLYLSIVVWPMEFPLMIDCTNTEEGLRNWTLTSRLWKSDSGLYAPPP